MAHKKCNFPKMKYRKHKRDSNPERTKKILEEKERRRKEWKTWLTG